MVKKIPDPGSGSNKFLALKTVSVLSEKLSGMFIPDPKSAFFLHPGSRVHKAPDPGSGTLIKTELTGKVCFKTEKAGVCSTSCSKYDLNKMLSY
jgi:hypothetical protein